MEAIDPAIAVWIPVVMLIAQAIGKLIPDTATGFLAGLRKFAKVIGLYVANNKT